MALATDTQQLKVTGSAERKVAPDEVSWSFVLRERGEDGRDVFEALRGRRAELLEQLDGLGEVEIDAQAIAVNKRGHWENVPPSEATQREILEMLQALQSDPNLRHKATLALDQLTRQRWVEEGHEALAGLRLKLSLELGEHVPSLLVGADAHSVHGPAFSISNEREIRHELLNEALADALARARQMAAAVGASLGEPVFVSDQEEETGDLVDRSVRQQVRGLAVAAGSLGMADEAAAGDGEGDEGPQLVELRPADELLEARASVLFGLGTAAAE
ncbi:MAG: SIMPL domain-containing protein [Solirubrobacterales bacterium]